MSRHGASDATTSFTLADCAASASAEAGMPSTSALSVIVKLKALVASSTLLENVVDSPASSSWILLNSSLAWTSGAHATYGWASQKVLYDEVTLLQG